MPFDPLAQVEDVGGVVWRFPAFGQIGLHGEDAWPHLWADLVPHELTVDEAQRSVRLEANRLMRIEVHRIIPAHAQDATALGLSYFGTPEQRRVMQWPGRERNAGRQASLEQITATHFLNMRLRF